MTGFQLGFVNSNERLLSEIMIAAKRSACRRWLLLRRIIERILPSSTSRILSAALEANSADDVISSRREGWLQGCRGTPKFGVTSTPINLFESIAGWHLTLPADGVRGERSTYLTTRTTRELCPSWNLRTHGAWPIFNSEMKLRAPTWKTHLPRQQWGMT